MSEAPTHREALLEARIKELEAAQKRAATSAAQGGMFEGIWRAVNAIVPPWLAVVALAVFVAHYALEYYVGAQVADAETTLQRAKADEAKARADAANAKSDDGRQLRLEQVRQQLRLKQAQAAQARVDADAQTATLNGESSKLAQVLAELDVARNQASLARAKANAEGAKFGYRTLEQRAQIAKVALEKQEVIANNAQAAMQDYSNNWEAMYGAYVRAECEDNEFAADISCPEKYIQRRPPPSPAPLPAATEAADHPQALRLPADFKCEKAWLAVDHVICHDAQLLDALARLEDVYNVARTVDGVTKTQHAWWVKFGPDCGLSAKPGRPAKSDAQAAHTCLLTAINHRIVVLESVAKN